VKVFGKNPGKYSTEVLSKLGYLSEDRDMSKWLSAKGLLNYTASFFDT
jgi:ABC-type multidrug transport system ATPase subunit